MSDNALSSFYHKVYRLAQEAVEALGLFTAVQNWFKTDAWAKDVENAVTNEDLLRVIATTSRKTGIVTLYILCDDRGQGGLGCNIYKLLERVGQAKGVQTGELLAAINAHSDTIAQIRLLRNNADAHYNEHDEWKRNFGNGLMSRDINRLLTDIFAALLCCGKELDIYKMSFESIFKLTFAYGERLIRALSEQVAAGAVGLHLQSVREWEEQDRNERMAEDE